MHDSALRGAEFLSRLFNAAAVGGCGGFVGLVAEDGVVARKGWSLLRFSSRRSLSADLTFKLGSEVVRRRYMSSGCCCCCCSSPVCIISG